MKKILNVVLLISMVSCLKVQKKSEDLEPSNNEDQVRIQSVPEKELTVERIENSMSLDSDLSIEADEVYFKPGVTIETNQFSVNIKAQKIYFEENIRIVNFSQSKETSELFHHGLSGGNISISADFIEGRLSIDLSGQNGSQGYGGWTFAVFDVTRVCNSGSGFNGGNTGSLSVVSNNSQKLFLTTKIKVGSGGAIGPFKDFYQIKKEELQYYKGFDEINNPTCLEVAHPGTNGTKGVICKKLKKEELPVCD